MSETAPHPGPIGIIRAAASALVTRSRWLTAGGRTFEGKRDLYEALGYQRSITLQDYRERYARNGVAARVVEALPMATWRGGAELIEDEDPDKLTTFEKAWDALNDTHQLWNTLQRADILAGLGRYAVVMLGTTASNFEQPLKRVGPKGLLYLSIFAEEDALIDKLVDDKSDPRFGLPEFYTVRRMGIRPLYGAVGQGYNFQRRVHHSHLIHVADGLLDDQVYAPPRLERIWNLLDDLEKVTGGGAEAFWKRADQGLQIDVDPELKLSQESKDNMEEQVEEYIHGLKRVMRTRGVTITPLGSDVAQFTGPADGIIAQISAATGIPQRILMGSERGELSSLQDKTNWDERVSDRRTQFAGPMVVRPLVDRLIELGVLPEPKEYEVRWPQIKNLNDAQRAEMAQRWAQLNAAMGEPVVTANEIRDKVLDLPAFTPEQEAEFEKKRQEEQQQKQQEQQQSHQQSLAEIAAKQGNLPPQFQAAVAHALEKAVAEARGSLDVRALRSAMARNDREGMLNVLAAAKASVATSLRRETERL